MPLAAVSRRECFSAAAHHVKSVIRLCFFLGPSFSNVPGDFPTWAFLSPAPSCATVSLSGDGDLRDGAFYSSGDEIMRPVSPLARSVRQMRRRRRGVPTGEPSDGRHGEGAAGPAAGRATGRGRVLSQRVRRRLLGPEGERLRRVPQRDSRGRVQELLSARLLPRKYFFFFFFLLISFFFPFGLFLLRGERRVHGVRALSLVRSAPPPS